MIGLRQENTPGCGTSLTSSSFLVGMLQIEAIPEKANQGRDAGAPTATEVKPVALESIFRPVFFEPVAGITEKHRSFVVSPCGPHMPRPPFPPPSVNDPGPPVI